MSTPNVIRWFVSPAFDEESLRSPQPCVRGIHCDYKRLNEETGELEPACCRFVHPGEEGNGRRLFPAREITRDGQTFVQPACVRLTGAKEHYYCRRTLKMSWREWCEDAGTPFTPALPGQEYEPVTIAPIGKRAPRRAESPQPTRRGSAPPPAPQKAKGSSRAEMTSEEVIQEVLQQHQRRLESVSEFPPLPMHVQPPRPQNE